MSPSPRRRNYHLGNQDGRSAARAGRLTPQQKAAVRKRARSQKPGVFPWVALLLMVIISVIVLASGIWAADR
jgi:hypothetical protein